MHHPCPHIQRPAISDARTSTFRTAFPAPICYFATSDCVLSCFASCATLPLLKLFHVRHQRSVTRKWGKDVYTSSDDLPLATFSIKLAMTAANDIDSKLLSGTRR
jgi:hypothetical protein